MGKYPQSSIHDWFSDWHYTRCAPNAYMTDVDRLWIEVREGKPAAVFDLKWNKSLDNGTSTEDLISEWFESKGVPYYVVRVEGLLGYTFYVKRGMDHAAMNERQMINWINYGIDSGMVRRSSKMDE